MAQFQFIYLVTIMSICLQASALNSSTVPSSSSQRSARQLDDVHEPTLLNRQFEASYLMPNFAMSTLLPIAILIGIGIILLKLFILSLWIFGRSGTPGYGLPVSGYGSGFPSYATAYSNSGWRGDGSGASARSLVDKNGFPASQFIGNKLLSLVTKVAEAIESVEKRYNSSKL